MRESCWVCWVLLCLQLHGDGKWIPALHRHAVDPVLSLQGPPQAMLPAAQTSAGLVPSGVRSLGQAQARKGTTCSDLQSMHSPHCD